MELISLIDYSDYLNQTGYTNDTCWEKHLNYVSFLKQPLTLGMFVPCDLDGNVLEEPNHLDYKTKNSWNELVFKSDFSCNNYHQAYDEYQEAKDRVLFVGFNLKYSDKFVTTVSNEKLWFNFKITNVFVNDRVVCIIEDLVKYNLELTPTAQKQIGL